MLLVGDCSLAYSMTRHLFLYRILLFSNVYHCIENGFIFVFLYLSVPVRVSCMPSCDCVPSSPVFNPQVMKSLIVRNSPQACITQAVHCLLMVILQPLFHSALLIWSYKWSASVVLLLIYYFKSSTYKITKKNWTFFLQHCFKTITCCYKITNLHFSF